MHAQDEHVYLVFCGITKNRLPYNLYCVGGDRKHCTVQSIHFVVMLDSSISNTYSVTASLVILLHGVPRWQPHRRQA